MKRARVGKFAGISVFIALAASGCDQRSKAMNREVDSVVGEKKERVEIKEPGPSHPLRAELEPVLTKLYPLNKPPRVIEADVDITGEHNYELEPGVAAVVRFKTGMGKSDQVKAIVMGTAEADAWAHRKDARRDYADLVHRVYRGFGEDQRDLIQKQYAHLRLLQFFNSAEAQAAIDALPADLKGPVAEMQKYYVDSKQEVWNDWMGVKMYARRVVAGDQPFRSVLRSIKKELGQEEPPPMTFAESMDPQFLAWSKKVEADEELLTKLTNLRELRDRQEYLTDTHTLWVMQGSARVPKKAKKLKIDKELGFGVLREDLGGGYNELTFVFSKKLGGSKLKKAFLQSIIFAHLLHDFQMLATAGSDWAKRDANNVIDSKTAIVPDEYDPLYAKCGSGAALDTLVKHFGKKWSFLGDISGARDEEKILNAAHKCVIAGADGKIHAPPKDDDTDVEGPAPGSRLALFQMLARYEDIDISAMASEKKTEEDEVIDEQEKLLKELEAQQAAAG